MRALRDFNTPKIVHSDEVRTKYLQALCHVHPIDSSGLPPGMSYYYNWQNVQITTVVCLLDVTEIARLLSLPLRLR